MIKIFKSIIRSTLVLFGPFWSYLTHMVLISAFSPIQSILSTKVLFSPFGLIQSTSVLSAYSVHIGSSRSILVLFCPLQSYSIHIGPNRTILFTVVYLVLFNPFCLLWPTSVLFGPFGPFWSYLVHFVYFNFIRSILSYSVHYVPFWSKSVHYVYFSLIGSCSVHFFHFGLIRSILVLFCPLQSYWVNIVLFGPFYPLWFYLVQFELSGMQNGRILKECATWWNIMLSHVMILDTFYYEDLSTNMWASHS